MRDNQKMTNCNFCGNKLDGLPWKCKYCHGTFCNEHRLPESHDCVGLKQYKERNSERWQKNFSEAVSQTSQNYQEEYSKKEHHHKNHSRNNYRKRSFKENIVNYFYNQYTEFKYWLGKREHHRYDYDGRLSKNITMLILLIASIVGFSIFYSNASKLNEFNLWIIKLSGVLIIISLFFAIKYGWRIIKELINLTKRQKNWIKYVVIILIFILLWQAYENKQTILNPAFDIYNKTNFSLFSPLKINNLSLDLSDKSANFNYRDNSGYEKSGSVKADSPLKPDLDISSLESEIHNLINNERQNNGLRALSLDSKLSEIARAHSRDMAQNGYFEHTNLRGQDPTDRANTKGYTCYKDYGSYYTDGIAENIFQNNLYDSITYVNLVPFHDWSSQTEIAQSTVQGWMNSPGHKQNILTGTYDKEGIGIAISSDDKVYITQDFC